jgi:hypothetical protein
MATQSNGREPQCPEEPLSDAVEPQGRKATPSDPESPGRRWIYLCLVLAFLIFVACGVVAVIVYVVYERPMPAPSTSDPSLKPTTEPTPARNETPDAFLSGLPAWTRAAIESDPSSPQARAYAWLRSPVHPRSTDLGRLTQRFALATFYYATRGESSWIYNDNWLSETSGVHTWFVNVGLCFACAHDSLPTHILSSTASY